MLLTCSDGEVLSYDDVGDPRGVPVVYLHGTPDSRLARHPDDGLAAAAGVRLLAVDRPGYGGSSAPATGTPAPAVHRDLAVHLGELLDHVVAPAATLLAWSGGTLAALAAARAPVLAPRLRGLVVVGGVAPREAYADPALRNAASERASLFELADGMPAPDFVEMVAPMLAPYPCDRPLAAEHQREQRGATDQAQLAQVPGAVEQMADALVEAVRTGLAGVTVDLEAQNYLGTVDRLDEIEVPVQLWYGGHDRTTPPELGEWYHSQIPGSELHLVDEAGHMLPLTHWPALLAALANP